MTKGRKEKLGILKEVEGLMKKDVKKARRLAMSHNLRLPLELRRKFCHKCNTMLTDSKIRLSKGKLSITCSKCGHVTRIPFKKS